MNHPLPIGTAVLVAYGSCQTCGPNRIQKVSTRIASSTQKKDGSYQYVLLDGRKVDQSDILEVR